MGIAWRPLLVAIWLLCGGTLLFNAAGIGHIAWYAPPDATGWGMGWFCLSWPYLLVMIAALGARAYPKALWVVYVGLIMIGSLGTLARFCLFRDAVQSFVALQHGRRMMNCGPPVLFFYVMAEEMATVFYVLIALTGMSTGDDDRVVDSGY